MQETVPPTLTAACLSFLCCLHASKSQLPSFHNLARSFACAKVSTLVFSGSCALFCKTPGVGTPTKSPVCFHNLTNPFSRNAFILKTIQKPRGCHPSLSRNQLTPIPSMNLSLVGMRTTPARRSKKQRPDSRGRRVRPPVGADCDAAVTAAESASWSGRIWTGRKPHPDLEWKRNRHESGRE